MAEPLIQSISDTARWVAYHRAKESERPDRIFDDPYARRLAGERGAMIGRKLHENAWAVVVRTYLFDRAILKALSQHPITTVVNLAAGLDSRPYRLPLASDLEWVEVDLPEIIDMKRHVLADATPHCNLDFRVEDLSDRERRRVLFSRINDRAKNVLTLSEGLLLYLEENQVASLAADVYEQAHFRYWLVEVLSPMVLDWMNRKWRTHLERAGAKMTFAPGDWRKFYKNLGWELAEFQDLAQTARKVKREPAAIRMLRMAAELFPGWNQWQAQLWESGVALLERA